MDKDQAAVAAEPQSMPPMTEEEQKRASELCTRAMLSGIPSALFCQVIQDVRNSERRALTSYAPKPSAQVPSVESIARECVAEIKNSYQDDMFDDADLTYLLNKITHACTAAADAKERELLMIEPSDEVPYTKEGWRNHALEIARKFLAFRLDQEKERDRLQREIDGLNAKLALYWTE